MQRYFGFDRIFKFFSIIKQNGGIIKSFLKIWRFDDLKDGELVGTDKYGNKYFENPRYFHPRNRWIEYAPHYGWNYDGSQVPAEWFGWLHFKTDLLPHQDSSRPQYPWMMDHIENLSGSPGQFMPYSTTLPKIHGWDPKSSIKTNNDK